MRWGSSGFENIQQQELTEVELFVTVSFLKMARDLFRGTLLKWNICGQD